jgi:hypothetical protein
MCGGIRAVLVLALAGPACVTARRGMPDAARDPGGEQRALLERFAPIVVQEVATDERAGCWDRPTVFDPDGSGRLADDYRHVTRPGDPLPFYSMAVRDGARAYLFYGLYYPMDWSGPPGDPHRDHAGDFEGALVVVARQTVEAVITQAHRKLHLWRVGSRTSPLTILGDRAVLRAESGGHGLYAFDGARSPAAAPMAARWISVAPPVASAAALTASIRPLSEIEPWLDGTGTAFRDLPRGARPPWSWGGGGVDVGAIVRDPARLYAALRTRG